MHIGGATEDTEVLEVWFRTVSCLVRREIVERCRRAEILEIDDRHSDLIPKFLWKLCVFNNRTNSAHNGAVCSFHHTVLLRMVGRCDLVLNPFFFEISIDKSFIFRAAAGSNSFNLGAKFRFEFFDEEFEVD